MSNKINLDVSAFQAQPAPQLDLSSVFGGAGGVSTTAATPPAANPPSQRMLGMALVAAAGGLVLVGLLLPSPKKAHVPAAA